MSSLMKWFDIIWSNPCQDYKRCRGAIAGAIGVNEPSPCITIIIIVTIKINNFILIIRGVGVIGGAMSVNEPATRGKKIWRKGKFPELTLMHHSHATSKCKTTRYKRKIVASLDFSTAQLTCKRGWISWIAGVEQFTQNWTFQTCTCRGQIENLILAGQALADVFFFILKLLTHICVELESMTRSWQVSSQKVICHLRAYFTSLGLTTNYPEVYYPTQAQRKHITPP